ncbi:MAG: hypothetical protein ACR2JU_08200 [Nocardioidaceae bacterium]
MAEEEPIARSPIAPARPELVAAGWAVSGRRSGAALRITDCMPLAKVAVKAPLGGTMAHGLGVRFGRSARQRWEIGEGEAVVLVVASGPGDWLVLGPPRTQDGLRSALYDTAAVADELVSVIDLTHGRALMRLTGEKSRDLLAKECGVDLADETCPDGAALRSAVSGVATDLIRDDVDRGDRAPTTSYLLHCERSSGQYLFDSLLDAGAELGVDIDGYVPPGL